MTYRWWAQIGYFDFRRKLRLWHKTDERNDIIIIWLKTQKAQADEHKDDTWVSIKKHVNFE